MNEKRNYKRPKHTPASIDGFVSGGVQLGGPVHRAYQPNKARPAPTLDSFIRRSDGFYPQRPASGSLGGSAEKVEVDALLNEPILLDEEPQKKRSRHAGHKVGRLRKIAKRGSLALGVLLVVAGAYFAIQFYMTQNNLFQGGGKAPALAKDVDVTHLAGEGDGRINILALGIGSEGTLTDTIMLISIDPINHKAALLSIPRDLWVKIPGDGSQKINAAFAYGKQSVKTKDNKQKVEAGLNLLDETISPIIGVPIHYHAVINFNAFKQAVDAVGGVSFYVPETLYDPTIAWENRGNAVIAPKGMQSFNGARALLYAKSRETSSDFARGERQRQVLVALKDKIFSLGTFSNPVKVSQLLSSLGDNVYTDFSLNDTMRLYEIMGQIPSDKIISLDLVKPPHDFLTTGNVNGLSVVRPKAGLNQYSDIQNYVRNALRDGFLEKENSKIAVYNATDVTGLATKKANELKSFGYNVSTVANTPAVTNPDKTTIIDLSKGTSKYTKHYLETRFGIKSVTAVPASAGITPPQGTNFVIILGKDAANSR